MQRLYIHLFVSSDGRRSEVEALGIAFGMSQTVILNLSESEAVMSAKCRTNAHTRDSPRS